MFEEWKKLDPLTRYEKYLSEQNLWDEKVKTEIEARIQNELAEDLEFAENSPFPPPELAEQGVYCEGCHTTQPEWRRPKDELLPPKSTVRAQWTLPDFGEIEPATKSGPSHGGREPATSPSLSSGKTGS